MLLGTARVYTSISTLSEYSNQLAMTCSSMLSPSKTYLVHAARAAAAAGTLPRHKAAQLQQLQLLAEVRCNAICCCHWQVSTAC
jgi:phage tail sheath gpL-like